MPRRKQDTPLKVKHNNGTEVCPDKKVSKGDESCDKNSQDISTDIKMKEENANENNRGYVEVENDRRMSSNNTADRSDLKSCVADRHQTMKVETAEVSRERSKTPECTSEELSQKYLMESLLQHQKQLYDQCSNNWINVQRSDNNCLSKSKAERYRWCVQDVDSGSKGSNTTSSSKSSTSHVANLKKTTASSLLGVTHPMQEKLYRTVFTGASKFRCRDCGKSFNTLVDLTVHMNKTGHYRDENLHTSADKGKTKDKSSKHASNTKNSAPEPREGECSEKVLKCMGCGYSFDSLQDLSVHMMKTKHYEQVPSLHYWSQRYNQSQSTDKQKSNTSSATSSSSAGATDPQNLLKQAQTYSQQQQHMFPGIQNLAQLSSALGGQSAAPNMFGYPPYFMPMPFSPFNGYSTNPALAAASLLLSNPWLAQMPGFSPSNFFPNIFGNPNNLMMKQQGSLPSYFSQTASSSHALSSPTSSSPESKHMSNDNDVSMLKCDQCKATFSSISKLSDHLKSSGHFPTSKNVTKKESEYQKSANSPSPNPRSSVASSDGSYKRHAITQNNNNCSKRSRIGPHQHLPTDKHMGQNNFTLGNKYLKPLSPSYIKPRSDKSNSVDFIKSLECTIQSAISKVADEGSHQPPRKKKRESLTADSALPNHKPSFSPFSSMSHTINPAHSSAYKNSTSPLSPLDLSNNDDKRDKDAKRKTTPRATTPVEVHVKDEQSTPPVGDPITCIRDNMRSLFAYMNLQNMKKHSTSSDESKSGFVERKHIRNENKTKCYKKHRSNSTSPRLSTIDKSNLNNGNCERSIKHERNVIKRKAPSESILQDLFIPKEDENMPEQNPLLQMENLVNHQLGKTEYMNKPPKKKSWPKYPPPSEMKPSTNVDENNNKHASPMSALLNFFANSNNYMHQTVQHTNNKAYGDDETTKPIKKSSVDSSPNRPRDTEDDEDSEQLRIKMAYFLQSMANSRHMHRSHSPPKPEQTIHTPSPQDEITVEDKAILIRHICTKLSQYDQINKHVCKETLLDMEKDQSEAPQTINSSHSSVKNWISGMFSSLNDQDHCDFLTVSSSDASIKFICSFCSHFDQTSDISSFIEHTRNHLNRSSDSTKSPIGDLKKDELSICDRKSEINGGENCDEVALLRSPASEIDQSINHVPIETKRCKLKMDSDPIQVSG